MSITKLRADFDRLALLSDDGWDHNSHYHNFLLKQLPARCAYVLEIGCGTGAFARQLAVRADRVLALDLSPEMIRIAIERSAQYPNIEFQVADVMVEPLPAEKFDCIASIATLHHLPFDAILSKLKTALKPGGTLLLLDLYENERAIDPCWDIFKFPAVVALRLVKTGRLRQLPEVHAAWDEHATTDKYLTLTQIRSVCQTLLPGSSVRRHWLWRYSLVWKKPTTDLRVNR